MTLNVFFPTEAIREKYMQKISNILQKMKSENNENIYEKTIHHIRFQYSYKKIPGYWIIIQLNDNFFGKLICSKIKEMIPVFWHEDNLFFPKEVTSLKQMKKSWFRKYNLIQEPFDPDAWKVFYKEAKRHWEEGRVEVAEAALMLIYKYNPFFLKKYRRYYLFEALSYHYEEKGEVGRSIQYLKMQANLQPDSAEPYLNMSSFLLLNGFYEEAIDVCKRGLEISPKDIYLRNNLLIAYLNCGYFEEAILYLQNLIKREPYSSANWKLAGDVFSQIRKDRLAVICYQKALAVNSEDIQNILEDIYYGLGISYQQLGQFEKAVGYYRRLLGNQSGEAKFLLHLSTIYRDVLHQFDEAERYGREFIRLYPQNGYGHYNLGLVYLSSNNLKKAKWHLYKAKKLLPSYSPVYDAIIKLKQKEKPTCK
ncbi:MAG TPA: tetratricopeptide repeat protein [Clostridiales bacterium]|nr:tetratricopeptide repeat protein [Clostridiales bacterium]